jgi:pimeloyl-ACP methyl ester carboxylesterase
MECLINNLPVHYETFGEGTPFLILHGYHVDHRIMTGCMEPVFEKMNGYRRIYVDLPGMGKTKGAEWIKCADDMLDMLLQFIERLMPGERFLLAGESYGGYLARGIVRRLGERVSGLFLLCPAVITDFAKRTLPEHTVMKKDKVFLASLTPEDRNSFTEINVVQTEDVWRRFRDEVLCGLQVADNPFLDAFQRSGYSFSFDPDAPYPNPALILTERQDSGVGYQDTWAILEHYPRATFAVLDRAGHNLQIEQPTLFNALVTEWLERVKETL